MSNRRTWKEVVGKLAIPPRLGLGGIKRANYLGRDQKSLCLNLLVS
jgi:hypothetical protein